MTDQLTSADLDEMTAEEIRQATVAGRFNDLLGIPAPSEEPASEEA